MVEYPQDLNKFDRHNVEDPVPAVNDAAHPVAQFRAGRSRKRMLAKQSKGFSKTARVFVCRQGSEFNRTEFVDLS
jgi:hypothetical protein